nr:hypothetical protein Iba_chr06aCG14000 [Ipomoea batatas]
MPSAYTVPRRPSRSTTDLKPQATPPPSSAKASFRRHRLPSSAGTPPLASAKRYRHRHHRGTASLVGAAVLHQLPRFTVKCELWEGSICI